MNKLIMLKGLPASGKSTYAKELVLAGYKRVNKDELRKMIDGGKWSKEREHNILKSEIMLVESYLESNYNVVVDDTNFAHESRWKEIAIKHKVEFEVKLFDTPFTECIKRDSERENKVGSNVIYRMYDSFMKPEPITPKDNKTDCFIFDIDGTLAKMVDRSPYDFSKVENDTINPNIVNICNKLSESTEIILVSGRDGICREQTIRWLDSKGIQYKNLYMREEGDTRKDDIIKKEIYFNNIEPMYNVRAVFDDRNQVVDMWRSLGITCLQVDYGFF